MTNNNLAEAIIQGLRNAIGQAEANGDRQEAERLKNALEHQLEQQDNQAALHAPPGKHPMRQEAAPTTNTLAANTARFERAMNQLGKPPIGGKNKFHEENSLAAYRRRAPATPPASTPHAERLAYWQQEQKEAQAWAAAFGLRAETANNEPARQQDLDDQTEWQAYQANATTEIRRIRDRTRKAKP